MAGKFARVGDQQIAAPHAHRQHHIRVETEDMINRQRTDGEDLLALRNAFEGRLVPGLALQDVGDQIAVEQHSALADPRGAAGVLQHRDVIRPGLGGCEGLATPLGQRIIEAHGTWQFKRGHHFFDVTHHVIGNDPFGKPNISPKPR
jgi:hypothetical protein